MMKRSKRLSSAMDENTGSPKRRRENAIYKAAEQLDDASSEKDGDEAESKQEAEPCGLDRKGKDKVQIQKSGSEDEELVWKPELIWTLPPKPMPQINNHPLLKSLLATSEPQAQQQLVQPVPFLYLQPAFPNIPAPTLYMEPMSPTPTEEPRGASTTVREAKERERRTPVSSPTASLHSCLSFESVTEGNSPSCRRGSDPEEQNEKAASETEAQHDSNERASEPSGPQAPRCTLHYYRRVQNAQEEGFHVIQGQVWHGQGLSDEGGESARGRRWRRHQWVIDGSGLG
jgi:hypothetical protein